MGYEGYGVRDWQMWLTVDTGINASGDGQSARFEPEGLEAYAKWASRGPRPRAFTVVLGEQVFKAFKPVLSPRWRDQGSVFGASVSVQLFLTGITFYTHLTDAFAFVAQISP